MKNMLSLNGEWSCTGYSPEGKELKVDALVPGTVHLDLMRAGIVKDLFYRDNALAYDWIEHWKWIFERSFQISGIEDGMKICFEGLDVYCDIYVNDVLIGSVDNMFIPHSFSVDGILREGANRIKVIFYPPDERTAGRPERSAAFSWPRVYTRRIQCTYGWDWVERFVTCGIIRPVYLYAEDRTELDQAYVYTDSIDAFSAQIKMDILFRKVSEDAWLRTVIYNPQGVPVYQDRKLIVEQEMYKSIDIPTPSLWYPNGYGEQALYRVRLEVLGEGGILSEKEISFGIRTMKILQKQDMEGSEYYEKCLAIQKSIAFSPDIAGYEKNKEFFGFILLVNGIPIMCKGANWVPCEPLQFHGNGEKIKRLLALGKKAGLNMLRVWGGGVFEEESFYDECDRLGILVAQDFLMACGSYPCEEAWFREHLEREAEYAALKLRNHACLAWWNGDNENAASGNDNQKDYDGRRGVREAIMPVLHRYDPTRSLFPSSPYGGEPYASLTSGTTHNTQFIVPKFIDIRTRDMEDYEAYLNLYLSRFDSEEPIMGAPSLTSLRKFMTQEDIFGKKDAMWRYHTRNNPCGEFLNYDLFQYLEISAQKLLGAYRDPEDRLFKLQYIQYEFVRKSMELYRRNKWFSAGIIYWMFNDMWPASGWALIDYYGMPKAGYYAFLQSAKPLIVSVQVQEGKYQVYVCNDSLQKGQGTLTVQAENFQGKSHQWKMDFTVEANVSRMVWEIPEEEMNRYTDASSVLLCSIESNLCSHSSRYYFTKPANVVYPKADVRILEQTAEWIRLKADGYVPAVRLEGEYVFEDNYFALMPGEVKTVRFTASEDGAAGVIQVSALR